MKENQHVLVLGASGGVGSFAVKLAKHYKCRVSALCSGKNSEYVTSIGADKVIDYNTENFTEVLKGQTVNIVLDCAGGDDYYYKAITLMNSTGAYVTAVGPDLHGGSSAVTMGVVMSMAGKLIKHKIYSMFGGPAYHFVSKLSDGLLPTLSSLLEKGVCPDVEKVIPLEQAKEAHEQSESHHAKGKIILHISKE